MTAETSEGQIPQREISFSRTYDVGVHTGGVALWKAHGREILEMHKDIFGPLFVDFDGEDAQFIELESAMGLGQSMVNPNTIFVTLQDKTNGQLAGFTFAEPASSARTMPYEKEEFDAWQAQGMTLDKYKARQKRTIMVGHAVIRPEHRSLTNWVNMLNTLESELHGSGRYDEMTSAVRQENYLAQHVRRRYHGQIITDIPNQPGPIGLQTYFRIALKK